MPKKLNEITALNKRINSLIQNIPDIIIQYDAALKVQFISQSAEQLINLKAKDIIGKRNSEVGLFKTDEANRLDEKLQKVFAFHQPEDFYTNIQYKGNIVYVYMKLVPDIVEGHTMQGVLAIARDITPMKQTEMKLQAKNDELERINRYMDEFVYAIAHDLRGPVANLKNIVSMFNDGNEDRKEQLMELLDRSVSHLDKTLNGLIDMIEAQADAHTKKEDCCNFEDIWADINTELADLIEESGAQLDIDFKNAPEVKYIQSFLTSVLRNLLSNAIKYRSEGRKLKITINTEKVDGYILLTVEDNGIGINLEKHRHQLFKPFKRFENQREGKGIGLHIIKNMVERNGGKIEVESTEGKGSKFKVYLKEY